MFCHLLGVHQNYTFLASTSIIPFQHADKAQQAFSAAKIPLLHNALPAVEALHAAWSKRAEKWKYAVFKDALDAATQKLNDYYQKTAESDAHILAMGTLNTFLLLPLFLNLIPQLFYSFTSWKEDVSFSKVLGFRFGK